MGPKNLATPAHLILSSRPMLRIKKRPRMKVESTSCQETSSRTILSSASRDYRRGKQHATNGSLPKYPQEKTSTMDQPWKHGGWAIQGETVTSTLNAHNQRSSRINEKMTPEQCYLGCYSSQKVWESHWWDKHSSSDLHDQQMESQDQLRGGI